MQFSFDKFNRYEIPQMVLCNPNFDELYVIQSDTSPKLNLRFNAISEMSFEISSIDELGNEVPYFKLLTKNRVIHLDGFGYWVIDSASVSSEGFIERKEVHCFSYEYMLTMRNVDLDAGTYNFYGLESPDDTLMGIILRRCPSWRIGNTISNELIGKYRTFDMPDTSVYDFLANEASEAYEAIFVFDNENLTINAYTASEIVKPTDIVFTWDNLMKSVEIQETDEPVITALDVYGSGDFSISSVNPLGTPTIYKFDHFKDQMSPELWDIVEEWQSAVRNNMSLDGEVNIEDYKNALDEVLDNAPDIADDSFIASKSRFILENIPKMEYKDSEEKTQYRDYTEADLKRNASIENFPFILEWMENLGEEDHKNRIKNCVAYPVICLEDLRYVYKTYQQSGEKQSWNIIGRFDVKPENKSIDQLINDILLVNANEPNGGKEAYNELLIIEAIVNRKLCEKYTNSSDANYDSTLIFNVLDTMFYQELIAAKTYINNIIIALNSDIQDAKAMYDSAKQVQDVSTPYSFSSYEKLSIEHLYAWIGNLGYDKWHNMITSAKSYPVVDFGLNPEKAMTDGIKEYLFLISEENMGAAEALVNINICDRYLSVAYAEQDLLYDQLEELNSRLSESHTNITLRGFFTEKVKDEEVVNRLLTELDKFIFGSTYVNEYYVLGEKFDMAEMQKLAAELYRQGVKALDRASQPNYTFSLDAVNFLLQSEYKDYINQCELGRTVNAEIRDGDWVSPVLLEISIDFDNPDDFSMVWGNRYRLQTAEWTWAELNNQVNRTSSALAANFSDMIKPVRSGDLDRFNEFMNSALDTAKNAVLAGNHQAMMIDSHGILGRKSLLDANSNPVENEYEPEQIKILNNGLYLTDDNWLNCAMAVGKVNVGGVDKFGVVADVLVGNMLIGSNLSIMNEAGNFSVNGSGMSFDNSSDTSRIYMNPTDGFHMQINTGTATNPKWEDRIAMGMSGDVNIAGELVSVKTVGGWNNEDELGLQKIGTSNFARLGGDTYAFSAGTKSGSTETAKFKVSYDGILEATNATISGKITASSGTIGGWTIGSTGNLTGDSAVIRGQIQATGGTIGGFTINSNSLTSDTFSLYPEGDAGRIILGDAEIYGESYISISNGLEVVGSLIVTDDFTVGGSFNPSSISASGNITGGTINSQNGMASGSYMRVGSMSSTDGTDYPVYWGSSTRNLLKEGSSSRRYKKDIERLDIKEYDDVFSTCGAVRFHYKDREYEEGEFSYGFIAEEVHEKWPHAIIYKNTEQGKVVDGINYARLTIPLVIECQNLRRLINDMNTEIVTLKKNVVNN